MDLTLSVRIVRLERSRTYDRAVVSRRSHPDFLERQRLEICRPRTFSLWWELDGNG